MERRTKAALAAARWLGVKEGSREHREILAVYNAIRPLPRGYRVKETDAWCAAFVSAAAVMAGEGGSYPLECSCLQIVEKAKEMGIWTEDDDHVPEIGDWVLYNWQAKSSGDDTGAPDHVGIVVGLENGEILAVEGNYDNAVKLRRFPVNYERIRGFVCPKLEGKLIYHTVEEVPDYGREIIARLVKAGALLGVSKGNLGLTEDLVRILVILDRQGKL